MLVPTRSIRMAAACVVLCALVPTLVYAFICGQPPDGSNPDQRLTLCSPDSSDAGIFVFRDGLAIGFVAPPREATTYVSPVVSPVDGAWGTLLENEVVQGITVSGIYMNVLDQRIEIAILQIGADEDSGVVGVDPIRVAWSSIFRANKADEFELTAENAGIPIQLLIRSSEQGGRPDTTNTAGLRVTFEPGMKVAKGWSAVFDVEDFDGFHIWRWFSDPMLDPQAVGTYNKVADYLHDPTGDPCSDQEFLVGQRPNCCWLGVDEEGCDDDGVRAPEPLDPVFFFADPFVINGNIYHYAIQTFDNGFNRKSGSTSNSGPFFSPLPPATAIDQPGPTQFRVDYLQPPPDQFLPVQAVPNPYRQSDCDPADLTTCTVRFVNLPPRGKLFIYTLAGDLVQTFDHPSDPGSEAPGTLRWDTRNGSGDRREVASGVYIYKIIDLESGQESFGRLAIIR